MAANYRHIPGIFRMLFETVLPDIDCMNLLGDYEEIYNILIQGKNRFVANGWLAKQFLKSFPIFIFNSIYWSTVMFKNYLTTAFRNIIKHRGFAFINIAGLALGMACCLLIMLWVMDEMSFDRFHENVDHLYRVEQDQPYSGELYHVNVTPYPMGAGIKAEIPEIVEAIRICRLGNLLFNYDNKTFFEGNGRAVDASILTAMTYPLKYGDPATALSEPHSLVLSSETALKYFGNRNPMGETIMINATFAFKITGVMKKIPNNSDFRYDFFTPYEFLRDVGRLNQYNDNWGNNNIITLVQLHELADIEEVGRKITEVRYNHVLEQIADPDRRARYAEGARSQFSVFPLKKIHLFGHFGFGPAKGAVQYVYIFTIIALFVLFIACINFMNLSTARSANRSREVGLRKVVGAHKRNLIGQFYGESILMAFISLALALILAMLLLPYFNTLAGKEMELAALFQGKFILGMLFITLFTGILSGLYPALFLSAFQPIKVLRGSLGAGAKNAGFRRILVVIQFSLSILLIIGTTVIYKQLNFMQSKKLGYDAEHMIFTRLRGDTKDYYHLLKKELLKDPRIVAVSASSHRPTNIGSNSGGASWEGKDPDQEVLVSMSSVDFGYVEAMDIEMAAGRSYDVKFASDSSGFLINETLADITGYEDPVGKPFSFVGIQGTILGVMKDYHYQPVREEIEPLALFIAPNWWSNLYVRLAPGDLPDHVNAVKEAWERIIPDYPFDSQFANEDFDLMYRTERRMGGLLQAFSILAILIACLGLFGLASFTAEQKTKEIGIRKALGASSTGVILLFSKEFTRWVLVSNLIAWPVAWFILRNWLQSFAYRTALSWWIFAFSGALALIIALITVSYQSLKAALSNPADSLRYE